MSIRATPCVGYWAAYYINRDGGWSVACDALGRIIRCETEKLALSVARYRRRRLQPLQGENPNLARTERLNSRDGAGRAVEIRGFPSLARTSGLAVRQPPIFVPNTASWKSRKVHPDMMHKLSKYRISPSTSWVASSASISNHPRRLCLRAFARSGRQTRA
jgi:hypothetical protein